MPLGAFYNFIEDEGVELIGCEGSRKRNRYI